MEKKILNDEIDLSDSLKTIWNNKWKIVLIAMITASIGFYFKSNTKILPASYLSITEIVPISSFDDYKYAAYNTYIYNSVKKKENYIYNFSNDLTSREDSLTNLILEKKINPKNILKNTYLSQIDKVYLFNLFIEKLNQKDLFIKAIKKFNLIKKNDYKDNKDYEDAVIRLSTSINIIDKLDSSKRQGEIKFQTNNKNNWSKVLEFVEEAANKEIKNYLKNNFELFILHAEREKKYLIEDIEFEISNNLENEQIILELNKLKKREQKNKSIERLKDLFENTPIIKSDNFIAAKFNIQSTIFKGGKKQNLSMKKVIFISILLGTLLGIFFVLVINNMQKKS